MEAAWISKNYGDDLYLQCTCTRIRVLDRRLAHSGKKDKDHGAGSIPPQTVHASHPPGAGKLVPDFCGKGPLSAIQVASLQPGYLRTPGKIAGPAFYDIQDEMKILKQQPKPHVKFEGPLWTMDTRKQNG
ncbi:unnamed protein product [Angiostrongylus costaricensis]|uniref:39S ribosomal protein L41, mitochondrial n=1 Tax=Angiostrongylus costaricensis TaxID=334426 RepID=A0A0R3PXZ6_ANGCS|nr:unnamed protein product [Angiostrongylus costaricensis]